MSPLGLALAFAIFVSIPVCGEENQLSKADLLDCAVECFVHNANQSGCGMDDTHCLCTGLALTMEFYPCVLASCSPADAAVTANYTATVCHFPDTDESPKFLTVSLLLLGVDTVFIVLRMIPRYHNGIHLYPDDQIILIGFTFSVASSLVDVFLAVPNGIGREFWTFTAIQLTRLQESYYVSRILYFIELDLMKLSILAFYLRIFPSPKGKQVIWGTIVISRIVVVALSLVSIFQCTPISFAWQGWDGKHEGHCIDFTATGIIQAAFSILLDVWMIAIALTLTRGLQLPWPKKLGVAAMFLIGLFATIVSILRLESLLVTIRAAFNEGKADAEAHTDIFASIVYATMESRVALWCACMPNLRLLVVAMLNKRRGKSSSSFASDSGRRGSDPTARKFDSTAGIIYSRNVGYGGSSRSAIDDYDDYAVALRELDQQSTDTKHPVQMRMTPRKYENLP